VREEQTVKSKTILLVEDNSDDVQLAMRAFKKNNIMSEVVVARDGAEALDYLFCTGLFEGRNGSKQPHVIFLDLKMPKVDGLEVLQRIRADERTKLLPVVVLTTSSEEKDKKESYLRGANSYIRKPMNFGEFVSAVQQLGLYWLFLNESP
jgi:two-component system, response regulator